MIYFGGIYRYLEAQHVFTAIKTEIEANRLTISARLLFAQAWQSKYWQNKGYDGATVVTDEYHPRLANFIHDYMWRTGAGGKESDLIYKYLLVKTGTRKLKAHTRYLAIRSAWIFKYRLKHKKAGNVRGLSEEEQNMYLIAKAFLK
jgi:hypothetical protein